MRHRPRPKPPEKHWPSLALLDAEIDEIMRLARPLDQPMPRHILNLPPRAPPDKSIPAVDWRREEE